MAAHLSATAAWDKILHRSASGARGPRECKNKSATDLAPGTKSWTKNKAEANDGNKAHSYQRID